MSQTLVFLLVVNFHGKLDTDEKVFFFYTALYGVYSIDIIGTFIIITFRLNITDCIGKNSYFSSPSLVHENTLSATSDLCSGETNI